MKKTILFFIVFILTACASSPPVTATSTSIPTGTSTVTPTIILSPTPTFTLTPESTLTAEQKVTQDMEEFRLLPDDYTITTNTEGKFEVIGTTGEFEGKLLYYLNKHMSSSNMNLN